MMRYGSVCSGIEAATVAWHPLGWSPVFFAEIEPFPCAVLAHHYPTVPNLGDMTRIGKDAGHIDLLVGGTPCQSFSVAGLRKGLADPRGNLALVFLRLVDELRPRWVVWENVPGVLSSGGGRDFGSFLGGLVELGYGFAYRVLDAQYIRTHGHPYAVPQRRRRVFVVGYLGDWRRAGAVLLERESLCGHPPPRREAGQGVAACLETSSHDWSRNEVGSGLAGFHETGQGWWTEGVAGLRADPGGMPENVVTHSLRADGFDASEDGTGRGTPIVPAYISPRITRNQSGKSSNQVGIKDGAASDCLGQDGPGAVAFQTRIARNGRGQPENVCPTLNGADAGATSDMRPCVAVNMAVRRLTPRECERLQGFPDTYTSVPYRGKPASDGPRYKALGNSMAANVMAWIGERIQLVEDAA